MSGDAMTPHAAQLREALEDLLKLPLAVDALDFLDRGIGTETEDAAWLRARQALSLPSPSEWRPIEDAPRDGTRVNVCWKAESGFSEHVELAKCTPSSGWCNTYGHPFSSDPDYWVPLPAPPETERSRK